MLVESLHMHNFMPYYSDVEIIFPTEKQTNTTIFFGENTKGKTSILNAFRWVLYGEAESKGHKLKYTDLLNRKASSEGSKKVFVELSFLSDKDRYLVRREFTDDTHSESPQFFAQKNGQPLTPEQGIQTIERIAPYGTRRFFLFDGELLREYEELMNPSTSTAKKIKKAIEDVMGFPTLLKTLDLLEEVEKKYRVESKNEKTSNAAVMKLKEDRENLAQTLKERVNEHKKLVQQEVEQRNSLNSIASDIDASTQAKEKYDELLGTKKERDQLKVQINEQESLLKEQKRDIWKSILEANIRERAIKAHDSQKLRENLQNKIQRCLITLETLKETEADGICPTCKQQVNRGEEISGRVQKTSEDLSHLQRELDALPLAAPMIAASLKLSDAPRINDYIQAEHIAQITVTKHADCLENISSLQDEIGDFDGANVNTKITRKVRLEQSLEELDEEINRIEDQIVEMKGKILALSKNIEKESGAVGISKENALLVTQRVIDIFQKSKGILRESIKKHVEEAAASAFLEMTSRPEDYSGLQITDSYGLEMLANDGSVVPQRSSGAEQVVALALIDGLNRVGKSPGPVIMDTPFGRLDETHRAKVLAYMPKSARQFMVFVHSGELRKDSNALGPIMHQIGKQYEIHSSGPYESYVELVK